MRAAFDSPLGALDTGFFAQPIGGLPPTEITEHDLEPTLTAELHYTVRGSAGARAPAWSLATACRARGVQSLASAAHAHSDPMGMRFEVMSSVSTCATAGVTPSIAVSACPSPRFHSSSSE